MTALERGDADAAKEETTRLSSWWRFFVLLSAGREKNQTVPRRTASISHFLSACTLRLRLGFLQTSAGRM